MSDESSIYDTNITGREMNFLYVSEGIDLTPQVIDDIKGIVGEKFTMIEYFPLVKLAFLWSTERLTDEELGKLNRLYGFYEVR